MNDNIALIGNPNCGKTTLFNYLTGTYQKVGNWAGVTTEKKEGLYRKDKSLKIVDLPGLYSLNVRSADERAVLNFLKETPPNIIINVVDGTNLERNLFLTTQLVELEIPMVIAVNFCDELENNGIFVNFMVLSDIFGVPVVGVSALKGKNVEKLIRLARTNKTAPKQSWLKKNSNGTDVEERYRYIENNINNHPFGDKFNRIDKYELFETFLS